MITAPRDAGAPAETAGALRLPASQTVQLRDGRTVRLRLIQPSDAELLREFDGALCEACHRFRYLGWMAPWYPDQGLTMATVDFEHRFAIVATGRRGEREVVVADCRLVTQSERRAEIAIAVADDHQGVGLGPAMIRRMLAIAADRGLETVAAQVRYDNERMMRVLRAVGFRRTAWEQGVVTFSARPGS